MSEYSEEFEAWFSETYPIGNLERTAEEVLRKMIASQAWDASRGVLVVQLPRMIHAGGPDDEVYWPSDVTSALESVGLKFNLGVINS